MLKRATFLGTLAGLGFLLGAISGALASEMPTDTELRSKIVDHLDWEMGKWRDGGKNKVLRLSATVYEHTTESHSTESRQFPRIEQPLGNKVAVTLGGLSLIGLELWWFLLSKPKSQNPSSKELKLRQNRRDIAQYH